MCKQTIRADESHQVGHGRTIAGPAVMVVLCVLIALYIQCSLPTLAGVGSEVTNGTVLGSLCNTNGSPAMYTKVKLIPSNYDPVKDGPMPDSLIDTTGVTGDFMFHVSDGGAFNIEGVQQNSGDRVLITDIMVHKRDTTTVPRSMIQKPGYLKVYLPSVALNDKGYLYCPGTTFWVGVVNGTAIIDSVPAGSIPVLCYVNKVDTSQNHVIKTNFTVTPEDTSFITDNHAWSFSRKLYINTTSSGAEVSSNVYSFPVLVRLSAGNFIFSQAKNGGDDVRFVKADGSHLTFEIERWDPVAQRAEIWVKVDTIYGNDSTHYITMLWGDSSATGSSKGAAVFDTASGFTAVWHLNTDCSDITTGKHDGTNFGATDTVGIIGGAKKFDGSSYIQVPGLLGTPQSITLSAWVHLDSTITFSQDIVSLGDAVALRADRVAAPYYGTEGFFCSKVSASDTVHVFTNTGAFISKTGWRYLTYTVDGARHFQSMYIDGIFQCSTNDINPINYSGLGPNTFLGTHGNKKTASYAFGCIDEARVCRVARSADWIKLCYMNQKQQDALVRW
jgi:hypothetical protein